MIQIFNHPYVSFPCHCIWVREKNKEMESIDHYGYVWNLNETDVDIALLHLVGLFYKFTKTSCFMLALKHKQRNDLQILQISKKCLIKKFLLCQKNFICQKRFLTNQSIKPLFIVISLDVRNHTL